MSVRLVKWLYFEYQDRILSCALDSTQQALYHYERSDAAKFQLDLPGHMSFLCISEDLFRIE